MKKLWVSILLLIMVLGLVQADMTFLDDLNQAQRYELSQAYLAVSQQYEELGDEERSQGYKDFSDAILATIVDLSSSEENVVEQAVEEAPQEDVEVDDRTKQALLYYFNKLGSLLSAEDLERSLALMSFPMDIAGYSMTEEAVAADVEELMEAYELGSYQTSDIWLLDTAEFYYEGDSVVMSINTAISDPGVFVFWNDPQEFIYLQADRGWKLAGIR